MYVYNPYCVFLFLRVCVCVEREKERERERDAYIHTYLLRLQDFSHLNAGGNELWVFLFVEFL